MKRRVAVRKSKVEVISSDTAMCPRCHGILLPPVGSWIEVARKSLHAEKLPETTEVKFCYFACELLWVVRRN